MSQKVVPRDVTSILQALRKWCFGGREYKNYLRFEDVTFAKRTQPEATLPRINLSSFFLILN